MGAPRSRFAVRALAGEGLTKPPESTEWCSLAHWHGGVRITTSNG